MWPEVDLGFLQLGKTAGVARLLAGCGFGVGGENWMCRAARCGYGVLVMRALELGHSFLNTLRPLAVFMRYS